MNTITFLNDLSFICNFLFIKNFLKFWIFPRVIVLSLKRWTFRARSEKWPIASFPKKKIIFQLIKDVFAAESPRWFKLVHTILGLSLSNTCTQACKYVDQMAWLPCWPPRGLQSLALKPREDFTRRLKQRYQWPHKKDWSLPKFF